MSGSPIYADFHATTPCDPQVVEAMLPWFSMDFGNAASRQHAHGWKAAEAVKIAREQVAALLNAHPEEIIFTSGATESVNLGLKGTAAMLSSKGKHIVTVETEHAAVLDTCTALEKTGFDITRLAVDHSGLIHPKSLEAAIRKDTILVAIMTANNETGVIQDMAAISAITRSKGVWLFSDATQSVGKMPVDVHRPDLDMMAFSAHKFYGPKGIGALYVRRRDPRVRLVPLIDGGGQERGLRSGTLNVPLIVGFGKAAELAGARMRADMERVAKLRDDFERRICSEEEVYVHGIDAPRLPTVSNLSFRFTEGSALLASVAKSVSVSSGSACASASLEPSHVLLAMGVGRDAAYASLRCSFGRTTSLADADHAASIIIDCLRKLRADSPVWDMYRRGILKDAPEWTL